MWSPFERIFLWVGPQWTMEVAQKTAIFGRTNGHQWATQMPFPICWCWKYQGLLWQVTLSDAGKFGAPCCISLLFFCLCELWPWRSKAHSNFAARSIRTLFQSLKRVNDRVQISAFAFDFLDIYKVSLVNADMKAKHKDVKCDAKLPYDLPKASWWL